MCAPENRDGSGTVTGWPGSPKFGFAICGRSAEPDDRSVIAAIYGRRIRSDTFRGARRSAH
jgi:hypothetical protein